MVSDLCHPSRDVIGGVRQGRDFVAEDTLLRDVEVRDLGSESSEYTYRGVWMESEWPDDWTDERLRLGRGQDAVSGRGATLVGTVGIATRAIRPSRHLDPLQCPKACSRGSGRG